MQQFSAQKRLNKYMGTFRHHFAATLALMLCLSGTLSAQQKAPLPYAPRLEAFRTQAEQMSRALYTANAALEAAHNTDSADAAAPLVLAVQEEHALMTAAAQAMEQAGATVTDLYGKGKLRQILRRLPIGRYNDLHHELLAKGCHGSVRLYLALTGRSSQFCEEQINAPLSEADTATLHRVAKLMELLRSNTNPREWKTEPDFARKLLALIDSAQPGIAAMQHSPAALMQFDALAEAARPHLQLLYERSFYELGDLEERLMRRPDNFLADLYSDYYRRTYFDRRAHITNHPSIRKLIQSRWEAAAPALAEFRKKYDLGQGDGRTPETAFTFPPHINRSNYIAFLNEFAQSVFGEDALYVQTPLQQEQNKFGKRIVRALAYGGRLPEPQLNEIHLINCYFYLPK